MKYLWVKWTILVWANAVIGLMFGLSDELNKTLYMLGIIIGICVFIPFYANLENYAQQTHHQRFIKALTSAMIIRICTQFFPILDIIAGSFAIDFVASLPLGYDFSMYTDDEEITGNTGVNIDGNKLGFFGGLLLTVVTGSILSLVVTILILIIMELMTLKSYYFAKK